jgi:predicted dehydrogenase
VGDVIGWGIWGTGKVSHQVADDFALVPGAVLRAVGSRSEERARLFAQGHRIERHCAGLADLLRDQGLDAIYVASPSTRHVDDCLTIIASGKAVLCEKPFALDAAEALRVTTAAIDRGVFCMEAMWTRFIPAVVQLKTLVDRGHLGSIRMLQGNFAYAVAPESVPRLFQRSTAGGALLDRGVYLLSLAQHLLGSPEHVQGVARFGPGGADENSAYQLTYQSGAVASFSASLRVRGSNEFSVFTDRARLRLHDPFYRAHRLSVQPNAAPAADDVAGARGWKDVLRASPMLKGARRRLDPLVERLRGSRDHTFMFAGNGYQFELAEASRCIAAGLTESPTMPLRDSVEVLRTVDALAASFVSANVKHP